jgi:hypothetical protein
VPGFSVQGKVKMPLLLSNINLVKTISLLLGGISMVSSRKMGLFPVDAKYPIW